MRSFRTVALLFALVAVAGWFAWSRHSESVRAAEAKIKSLPLGVHVTSVEQVRALNEAQLRLRPDLRFVRALERLTTLAHESGVRLTFQAGHWSVMVGSKEIDQWPDGPDFDVMFRTLAHYAQAHPVAAKAAEDHGATHREAIAKNWSTSSEEDIARLEAEPTRADISAVASGLAKLVFATQDPFGLGTELQAAALASLACATDGENPDNETAALLASSLGYPAATKRFSSALPPGDALRLYLDHDATVESLAGKGSRETYFALRSLVEHNELPKAATLWKTELKSSTDSPVLDALVRSGDPGTRHAIASQIAGDTLVAAILAIPNRDPGDAKALAKDAFSNGRALSLFDDSAPRGPAGGVFFDGPARLSLLNARFFGAVADMALLEIDFRASPTAAADLSRALGPAKSDESRALVAWIEMASALRSRPTAETIDAAGEAIASDKRLTQIERLDLLNRVAESSSAGDRRYRRISIGVVPFLDSRPSTRALEWAWCFQTLPDLEAAERIAGNLADQMTLESAGYLEAWELLQKGELEKMRALASSPALHSDARELIFAHVRRANPKDTSFEDGVYDALFEAHPETVRTEYVRRLLRRPDPARARKILEKHLDEMKTRHAPGDELDLALTRAEIGNSYIVEREFKKCLSALGDAEASGAERPMWTTSVCLAGTGSVAKADAELEAMIKRYPGPETQAAKAEALWIRGDYDAAARIYATPPTATSSEVSYEAISDRLAFAFAGKPAAEEAKAISAIIRASPIVGGIALDRAKRMSLARSLELLDAIGPPADASVHRLWGEMEYDARAALKNPKTASAWLAAQPAGERTLTFRFAWQPAHYESVWNWDVPPPPYTDGLWVLRALQTSHETDAALKAKHTDEIVKYFDENRASDNRLFARYQLGLEPQSAVIPWMDDPNEAPTAAFHLGFAAEREGRYRDASTWYRTSAWLDDDRNAEPMWAIDTLMTWTGTGETIASLEAKRARETK